jgi:hypothetical protein
MTIERGEAAQITRNDARIAQRLYEKYGNMALSEFEHVVKGPTFSEEASKKLQKRGNLIFELRGHCLKTLREDGHEFSRWHKNKPEIEEEPSLISEVSINPQMLFLPDSDRKTMDQQDEMLRAYSEELSRDIPGVKAVWGQVSDFAELATLHTDMFGVEHNFASVRTATKAEEKPYVLKIGHKDPLRGLQIQLSNPSERCNDIYAPVLIVPSLEN